MPPNWPGSFCFFAPWKLATMKEVALWYQHAKENSHTEKAVASHTKWREMTRNPRWQTRGRKAIMEVDPPVRAAETTAQPNPFQMFELQIMSKIE